jgi:site-specific DNA-methyltransferase (adenine-specific)
MLIPPTAFEVFQADVLAWLRARSSESVDLVLTDPAYESLEKHRAVGTTTRLTGSWFPVISNEALSEVVREFYRVLRRDRHAYVFCDWDTAWKCIAPAAEAAGFTFWTPIVWDKVAMGMGYHYRSRYELVCFLEKGKRRLRDLGEPNVQAWKRVRGGYPTEKPVDFGRLLVRQSSEPGELVLDPFMGSGAFGEAAVSEGRLFVGVDVQADAVDGARRRIKEKLDG